MGAIGVPAILLVVWLATQRSQIPLHLDRSPHSETLQPGIRDIDEQVRFLNARLIGLDRASSALSRCLEHPLPLATCPGSRHEKVIIAQELTSHRAALRRRAGQLSAMAHGARQAQADRRVAVPVLALPPVSRLQPVAGWKREDASASASASAPAAPPQPLELARLPQPEIVVSGSSAAWLTEDLALRQPVDGRLLPQPDRGRYGRGLLIEVGQPRPVAAPAAGTVRFAGTLHGYGLVLIIEHGSGYHSVLAGLARLDVDEATDVVAGQTVGSITAANGVGRLYVELRRHGAPLNPAAWTAAREDKVAG